MKILYEGIEYHIWFNYIRPNKSNHNIEFTECWIESLENGIQVEGLARKAPGDQFVKEIGRKLSFSRALSKLFPNNAPKSDGFVARNIFWHCYFASTNQNEKIYDLTLLARKQVTWK